MNSHTPTALRRVQCCSLPARAPRLRPRNDRTFDAMRSGAQIITQGVLAKGQWIGRADVLKRVETASVLGPWSYEIIDTKLARETKGGTVLQLCLYSNLLAATQQREPEFAYV